MASIMSPLGYQYNSCGYCKSDDGNKIRSRPNYYGRGPRTVKPLHYERLADRGWRRSGSTYYKPDVRNACCPHYTIRLDSSLFKASRNHRKVCNRFTKWIVGNEYPRQAAKLCSKTRSEKRHRKQEFDIFERVHEPDYKYMQRPVNPVNGKPIEPEHKLEVNIEQDNFTEEKYALFAHYQEVVHKEPPSRISEGGFRGFLCSGMHQGTFAEGGRERKIGSFHQCYRIDGRLVALGVLDLMPHCVSSVYLIYHQDFNRWEFGKLSALREIAMAIEEGYRYYYMGYYIHSCTKMKYKRDFRPTYVLDPESYEWNLFDEDLLTRLNSRKYVSLSRERRLGIASTATDPEEKGAAKQNYEQNLFSSRMPGITTPEDIMANLRTTDLRIMHRKQVVALGGMPWVLEDMHDPRKLQGVLADFVACVGIENVKDWVLALSHIFGDEDE